MIIINRPKSKHVNIIRAASIHELYEYEKRKLNNTTLPKESLNSEAKVNLKTLAFKNNAISQNLSANELVFTKCELDK